MKKFFKQVHNSGIARINLMKRHPGSLKLVHLLPAIFTVGVVSLALLFVLGVVLFALGLCGWWVMVAALAPLLLYSVLIFVDSLVQNRSLKVAALSIYASFVQLLGYGTGFIRAWWLRCVCGRNEELQAFRDNFYQ
jgi:hypothetical protein